jgi:hypothetical protein
VEKQNVATITQLRTNYRRIAAIRKTAHIGLRGRERKTLHSVKMGIWRYPRGIALNYPSVDGASKVVFATSTDDGERKRTKRIFGL